MRKIIHISWKNAREEIKDRIIENGFITKEQIVYLAKLHRQSWNFEAEQKMKQPI
jgi:hypothetical protein